MVQIDEWKSSGTDPPALVSSVKGYDDLDRLTSETDVWAKTLTYGYDDQGNRTSLTDTDSVRTEYAFDALNRLETLTLEFGTPSAQTVTYEYLPNGLKDRVTNPNGTATRYGYDAASRMTSITHTGPSGVVSAYEYSYGPNGNRIQQIEQNAGKTETTLYDYDLTNRLKTVTYEAGTTAANQTTYTYDPVGNRLSEQAVDLSSSTVTKDLTYSYDAINRLDSIDDVIGTDDVTYAYDANGNTLSKTTAGVTTDFKYDLRNQLSEVLQGPSVLGRYGFDYEGLRILKIGDDGIRQYTYDQLSVITESSETSVTVSKYDYGLDQLVSLDNTSEGRSFFHLDVLRSTANLTDGIGGTRQSILYDGWGNERERVGASANNFTYTGHEKDEETGLIYAKARFYDPDIGRFLSQDSYLGDASNAPTLHRYFYANQNPIRFWDPDGFQSRELKHFKNFTEDNNRASDEAARQYLESLDEEERKAIEAWAAHTSSQEDLISQNRNSLLSKRKQPGLLSLWWEDFKASAIDTAANGYNAVIGRPGKVVGETTEEQLRNRLRPGERTPLSDYDQKNRIAVEQSGGDEQLFIEERLADSVDELKETTVQGSGMVAEEGTKVVLEAGITKAVAGTASMAAAAPRKLRPIAIGLSRSPNHSKGLAGRFAEKVDADTYWDSYDDIATDQMVLDRIEIELGRRDSMVNLSGLGQVDALGVDDGLAHILREHGSTTEKEIVKILQSEEFFERATFFLNGVEVQVDRARVLGILP